jgi:ATP adenylyltransferase
MARTLNFAHARTKFQRDVMRRIARDKVCPFCMKHFLKYHTKPILRSGKYWVLTENFQPYEGSKHHLLAVSKKHTTHFGKLPSAAQAELFGLMAAELKKRKVPGGALFMRFGDTDYTGGSVEHLHAQLVSGAKRGKGKETLTIYLGYKVKSKKSA